MRARILLSLVLVLAWLSAARAADVTFSGSLDTRTAQATFHASGTSLVITLSNTSVQDVTCPDGILTAVMFDMAGRPHLSPVSVVLASGSSVLFGSSGPGGVVGGEWCYKEGPDPWKVPQRYVVGAAELSGQLKKPNFPGSNLYGGTDVGGIDYGLTSAGDNPTTGSGSVSGSLPLIKHAVVITLSGLPSGFNPAASISNVCFQYNKDGDDPYRRLCATATVYCGNGSCEGGESCASCPADCGTCPPVCGNGTCEPGESCADCWQDCGLCPPSCGNGVCEPGETCATCPGDCGQCCGNGLCDHGESWATCPGDCPPACGDGFCNGSESWGACPADCPPACGDTYCNGGETCATCPGDCGPCCGNGLCDHGESWATCPGDCPPACGDGFCNGSESWATCPADCPPTCGDTYCNGGESWASCPADCPPACGDGYCNGAENWGACPQDCPPACGDGFCNGGETWATCPGDCPPACGDGFCNGAEGWQSCPADCPPACGDGFCNGGEDCATCPGDCGPCCGNGLCDHGESWLTCPGDCPPACGDGYCNGGENWQSCPADCPPACGDGVCNGTETCASCQADCGQCCGNGLCDHGETWATCPGDCPPACGDGYCNGAESWATCPADCPPACGDGACNGTETCASCQTDCGQCCGNGLCDHGESCATCQVDCGACCGNGICDHGESCATCPGDCGDCPPTSCGNRVCDPGESCSSCPLDCGNCPPAPPLAVCQPHSCSLAHPCPAPSTGRVLTVPADVPDIQTAIDFADDGDTIVVKAGIYAESIDFRGKSILVKSEQGPERTIITGSREYGLCPLVTFECGELRCSILDGFTIAHPLGVNGGGVYINQASPQVRNCHITGNTAVGEVVPAKGAAVHVTGHGAYPLLINNLIYNNTCSLEGPGAGGVYVCCGAEARIESCTVTRNFSNVGAGGLYVTGDATATFVGNSVVWGNLGQYNQDLIDEAGRTEAANTDFGLALVGYDYLSFDPLFMPGCLGGYYLGQDIYGNPLSPGYDAGFDDAQNIGDLGVRTCRPDGAPDLGVVDLGFHHAATPVFITEARVTDANGHVLSAAEPGQAIKYVVKYIVQGDAGTSYVAKLNVAVGGQVLSKGEVRTPGTYEMSIASTAPVGTTPVTYTLKLKDAARTTVLGKDWVTGKVTINTPVSITATRVTDVGGSVQASYSPGQSIRYAVTYTLQGQPGLTYFVKLRVTVGSQQFAAGESRGPGTYELSVAATAPAQTKVVAYSLKVKNAAKTILLGKDEATGTIVIR